MNEELLDIRKRLEKLNGKEQTEAIALYPGIDLFYFALETDSFSMRHSPMEDLIQINYCKSGQMVWDLKNGTSVSLNPGDFSLHTMRVCADSVIRFPTGQYTGLTFFIDLQEAAAHPPELLKDTEIFNKTLREQFCRQNTVAFFAGNERTESIFSPFYHQPEHLKLPYQRIKTLELFLYLSKTEAVRQRELTVYPSEQTEMIREIHDRLTRQMGERITIEALSKQYLINPTTLKAAFKSVYGMSIAAHMKKHRMEQAAKLLRESDLRIAEIAQAVGYDSQSKFTAAFKAFFQVLPREYRKNHSK